MITIRTTMLEGFRLLMTEDWKQDDELIAQVQGKFVAHEAMEMGSAWHKCLEEPVATWVVNDGVPHHADPTRPRYWFRKEAVAFANEAIGPGRREVPLHRDVDLPGIGTVRLTGTIDHKIGLELADIKLKVRSAPKADDYEKSLQWRSYLWLSQGYKFNYYLFPAYPDERGPWIEVEEPVVVPFWDYDGMGDDLTGWLRDFVVWLTDRRLLACLDKPA